MLPFKLAYHERYDLNLGPHVFPSQKFRLIYEMLLREDIATPQDFLRPDPAADEDILRVHTPDWVRKLKTGTLTASEVMLLEVPYSPELVEAVWLAAGGTILAGQSALRDGFGSNLSGGFHHAYPGHGEGFCAIHDVAVAIRKLQADGAVKKAMVVDTDVHHGNGTAAIFRNDPAVFTISIHQENNYPAHKPPSSIDLNMADRANDDEYLGVLIPAVQKALDEFRPDILFYVGGADPYCEDQTPFESTSIRFWPLRKWQRNIRKVHRCVVRALRGYGARFPAGDEAPWGASARRTATAKFSSKVSGSKPFER